MPPKKPTKASEDTIAGNYAYAVGHWNNIRKLYGHKTYISKPQAENYDYIMANKSTWSKKDFARLLYEVAKIDPIAYQSYTKIFSNPAFKSYLPSPTLEGYPEHSKLSINLDKLKSEFKPPSYAEANKDWGKDLVGEQERDKLLIPFKGPPSEAIALSTRNSTMSADGESPRAYPKSFLSDVSSDVLSKTYKEPSTYSEVRGAELIKQEPSVDWSEDKLDAWEEDMKAHIEKKYHKYQFDKPKLMEEPAGGTYVSKSWEQTQYENMMKDAINTVKYIKQDQTKEGRLRRKQNADRIAAAAKKEKDELDAINAKHLESFIKAQERSLPWKKAMEAQNDPKIQEEIEAWEAAEEAKYNLISSTTIPNEVKLFTQARPK